MVRNSATNPYFWNNLKNFKLYTMHIFWLRNYNITKYSLITLYSLLFSGNTLHDVQKHLKYIKLTCFILVICRYLYLTLAMMNTYIYYTLSHFQSLLSFFFL